MSASLVVETFPVGRLQCNCTILGDTASGEAIVVDPGDDADKVLLVLARHKLRCKAIVNTHTHIDHVGGNQALRDATGARVMLHEADLPLYDNLGIQAQLLGLGPPPPRSPVDEHIHQGDRVRAGALDLEVLHTPGHTPGSLCFHLPTAAPILLSGDTLFAGSIGRTDLEGGDMDTLVASIRRLMDALPGETIVASGHGPATTLERERQANPFLGALRS